VLEYAERDAETTICLHYRGMKDDPFRDMDEVSRKLIMNAVTDIAQNHVGDENMITLKLKG